MRDLGWLCYYLGGNIVEDFDCISACPKCDNGLSEHTSGRVYKTKDGYMIEMAVPGYEKSDINISVEENNLIIASKEEMELDYWKKPFKHVIGLPSSTVNVAKTNAHMKDGILKIKLPFDETKKPISIEINAE